MGKKIKGIYIITIISIIGFLCMQCRWLVSQYRYSIQEYEKEMSGQISLMMQEYDQARRDWTNRTDNPDVTVSNMNMDHSSHDNTHTQDIKATVTTKFYNTHKILNIPADSVLSVEDKHRISEIVNSMRAKETDVIVREYKLNDISQENDIWNAMRNVELDIKCPFTIRGIDSIMRKHGVKASLRCLTTDSIEWNPLMLRNAGILDNTAQYLFPYNPLDRKALLIEYDIPADYLLKNMAGTLIVSVVVSLVLILCLIWQIRIIRHLMRVDSVRNSFVHTMIHELKRPISTLKICVSSLESSRLANDEANRAELVADCRAAVNNLSTYFSRLRDITFNEGSQIPLNPENCRLHDIAQSVIAKTAVPPEKNIEIVNDVAVDSCVVADALHLSQILCNLVENAVKYAGDNVRIVIGSHLTDNGVSITVSDNGCGIDEDDAEKIFGKFYRCPSAIRSGAPGIGLGLAYVRLLAEAHGGSASVAASPGKGCIFTITLPQQ